MTGKYGTPEHHPNRDRANHASRKPLDSGIPPLRIPAPPHRSPTAIPESSEAVHPDHSELDAEPVAVSQFVEPSVQPSAQPAAPFADSVLPAAPSKTPLKYSRRGKRSLKLPRLSFLRSWQFWGAASVLAFSGIGVLSALVLLRLPSVPNCPAIFWPTASASLRIYCAQLTAERHTVDDLLTAIELVNRLPPDHPLRPEINRNIEEWAKEILILAEQSFQQGHLTEAIADAKRIPSDTAAHQLVDKQIQQWRAIWANAEKIYGEAEMALQKQDLRQAFSIATRLLEVGNTYWETTKYQELNHLITRTREDGAKLDQAKGLADQGGLANLLKAIELAEEVNGDSPLYARAQERIQEFGRDMLALAEEALAGRDYNAAIDITRQIPEKAGIQAEVQDFETLAEAQARAWTGIVEDIESAILHAQKIGRDRPLYGRAQQLITYWHLEIQDVQRLNTAQRLAQGGAVGDLRAAIAEAQMVPVSNPRGDQAQDSIDQWITSIETMEDRPYLDRAEQLASRGDMASLRSAISEAERIGSGRALYGDASQRIREWTAQIQRIEDQPILTQARLLADYGNLSDAINIAAQIDSGRALYDEAQGDIQAWTDQLQRQQDQPYLTLARQLASQGDISRAIATASQIRPGRVLYDEAQTDIQAWSRQSEGQDQLQQAYETAQIGTSAMLLMAIDVANQIPEDSPSRAEADHMINRWSWQLLQMAETQATLDPMAAIAIAEGIPPYTEAYSAAQQQVQEWQQQFSPTSTP
ncbi:MAG: chromosome segregation ATPase [Cyanobacteria bacterium CRU_2_1]|nr:chromosome segregation ATPase [Cyanobacteria bacterium RU_5_0]NJR58761.1 chromosome segregation ATPase [Cyanobacteria bacterium CRU_2_1]